MCSSTPSASRAVGKAPGFKTVPFLALRAAHILKSDVGWNAGVRMWGGTHAGAGEAGVGRPPAGGARAGRPAAGAGRQYCEIESGHAQLCGQPLNSYQALCCIQEHWEKSYQYRRQASLSGWGLPDCAGCQATPSPRPTQARAEHASPMIDARKPICQDLTRQGPVQVLSDVSTLYREPIQNYKECMGWEGEVEGRVCACGWWGGGGGRHQAAGCPTCHAMHSDAPSDSKTGGAQVRQVS